MSSTPTPTVTLLLRVYTSSDDPGGDFALVTLSETTFATYVDRLDRVTAAQRLEPALCTWEYGDQQVRYFDERHSAAVIDADPDDATALGHVFESVVAFADEASAILTPSQVDAFEARLARSGVGPWETTENLAAFAPRGITWTAIDPATGASIGTSWADRETLARARDACR